MAQARLTLSDSRITGKNRTRSPINDLTPCLFCPLPAIRIVKLGMVCLRLCGKPLQERRAQYSQLLVKNQLLNCLGWQMNSLSESAEGLNTSTRSCAPLRHAETLSVEFQRVRFLRVRFLRVRFLMDNWNAPDALAWRRVLVCHRE